MVFVFKSVEGKYWGWGAGSVGKWLPCREKDLSLVPKTLMKKPGVGVTLGICVVFR